MMLSQLSIPSSSSEAACLFKRLWVHEVYRVFFDRLVDDKDREWLLEQVGGGAAGVCVCGGCGVQDAKDREWLLEQVGGGTAGVCVWGGVRGSG